MNIFYFIFIHAFIIFQDSALVNAVSETITSTHTTKAPQNGSHLLHGKLATQQ